MSDPRAFRRLVDLVPATELRRGKAFRHVEGVQRLAGPARNAAAVTPQVTIGRIKSVCHFKRPEDLESYIEGLRKAGMPA